MRLGIVTLAVCCAVCFDGPALAAECSGPCDFAGDYKNKETGFWNTVSIWCECDGDYWVPAESKPDANNPVIIIGGTTVTVSSGSEACDDLTIQGAATEGVLAIEAPSGQLTVGGALNMQDPSRIEFTGTGTAGLLTFSSDVTADEEIVVKGPGKLAVANGYTLTLDEPGIIKGGSGNQYELEISGDIENDGDIEVKEGFNLKFTGHGLNSDSSGTITIDHATGSVQFAHTGTDPVQIQTAEVFLHNGLLDVDSPLEFRGKFEMKPSATVNTEDLGTDEVVKFCQGLCSL